MDTNANGRPRRRIIVAAPRTIAPVLAPVACPFVHAAAGARPACSVCKRVYTAAELKEFAQECNGDERCGLGRHIASCCERCAADEVYGKPKLDTTTPWVAELDPDEWARD
jgi:hypothetical protein